MIILLLSTSLLIQISILVLLYFIYKQKTIIKVNKNVKNIVKQYPKYCKETYADSSNNISCNNEIIEAIEYPKAELIKQIIALDDYTISFKTSYDGFLYVTAKYANLYCDNKRTTEIIRHLEKYFIKKDTYISIENINQLKSIRFIKWSNEEFIADMNKGIFKKSTDKK